jgi:hypothetical protein
MWLGMGYFPLSGENAVRDRCSNWVVGRCIKSCKADDLFIVNFFFLDGTLILLCLSIDSCPIRWAVLRVNLGSI